MMVALQQRADGCSSDTVNQGSAGSHSLEAWRWAWSCAHSRSFKDGAGGHLIVPGIDMANHAFAPSASVRSAVLCTVLYGDLHHTQTRLPHLKQVGLQKQTLAPRHPLYVEHELTCGLILGKCCDGMVCRLVRDPDRCQGHTAMADVCDPDLLPPGEARVELVAGDAGLR